MFARVRRYLLEPKYDFFILPFTRAESQGFSLFIQAQNIMSDVVKVDPVEPVGVRIIISIGGKVMQYIDLGHTPPLDNVEIGISLTKRFDYDGFGSTDPNAKSFR